MTALERIWAWEWADQPGRRGRWHTDEIVDEDTESEYIRADLHAAAVEERDALRGDANG